MDPIDSSTNAHRQRSGESPRADQAPLRIHLLGDFRVTIDGKDVDPSAWQRRKAKSLVKVLALTPRHALHREELMDLLWPDQEPAVASANLRVTLHGARRAMLPNGADDTSYLKVVDDEIVLQRRDLVWVDAEAFEQSSAIALRSKEIAAYRDALDLYAGELLPEDRYEDWASSRRERLRGIYLSLLSGFADALERAGDTTGTIDALEQVLATDPTYESAARQLMRAYARSGQRNRALRLYRFLRDALARDLDAPPEPETQQLYGEILAGGMATGATSIAEVLASTPRHNLRVPLTSFVGREQELQRVGELIASTRLLSLIGSAGCGKTRLSIMAAQTQVETFEDGVWFVDLSPLVSAEPVVQAIATAMGQTLDATQPERTALIEMLRSRRALLVLDNCEHLISASAEIVEHILQTCPTVHIMTTSREPLHIAGEMVMRVPVMPLPVGRITSVEQVERSDAVRLFLDRVRALQPDFALTTDNAPLLADICRRLDGLPLAIELAAARMPVLSLEQLARRLDDPFQVLAGGNRTAEPRQQTLRATFDWSFDALDMAEKLLLERLSVFAGTWTLDAAEAICAGDGIEHHDVLSLLAQLVDKSLVDARAGTGEVRYRLLVTIRQYAAERLAARGDTEALHARLADFYVQLAEAAGAGLLESQQGAWLERLELELDNLRAALDWCARTGNTERQLRIAASLVRMWWIRGYASEGRRWLESAIDVARSQPEFNRKVQAKALQAAGNLARMQGHIEQAQQHLEECLALQRSHGDSSELAHVLNYLAALLGLRADLSRAMELAEEGLVLFRKINDARGIALTLGTLGELTFAADDAARSSRYLEEALALDREIGDTHSIAITLNNLGEALRAQGSLKEAEKRFQESLEIFRALEATHGVAYLLANLGDIARGQHRHQEAHRHYLEALAVFRELGYRQATLSVIASLAALDAHIGQPVRAATMLGAEEALRAEAGFVLTPVERADIERSVGIVRGRLTSERFEAAWQAGRAMSLDEVAVLAGAVELSEPANAHEVRLSPRERDVALLAARGMTNQQIAATLGMSVRTAETHIGNVFRKLDLSSRRELHTWAVEHGLLASQVPVTRDT